MLSHIHPFSLFLKLSLLLLFSLVTYCKFSVQYRRNLYTFFGGFLAHTFYCLLHFSLKKGKKYIICSELRNRQWIWTLVNLISGQTKLPKKSFSQCPIWKGETRCENGPKELQSFGNKSCGSNQKWPVWCQIYSKVRFFFSF